MNNVFQINEWMGRHSTAIVKANLTKPDIIRLESALRELDVHLILRSYVVGYSLSAASTIIWGALRGNKVA